MSTCFPGRLVRQECVEALGLSVADAAERLGVSSAALEQLMSEQASISEAMAAGLAQAFGGTAETWLCLQAAYETGQGKRP